MFIYKTIKNPNYNSEQIQDYTLLLLYMKKMLYKITYWQRILYESSYWLYLRHINQPLHSNNKKFIHLTSYFNVTGYRPDIEYFLYKTSNIFDYYCIVPKTNLTLQHRHNEELYYLEEGLNYGFYDCHVFNNSYRIVSYYYT